VAAGGRDDVRVLLVEDDAQTRRLLNYVLHDRSGHEVFEAKNGLEAIEIAQCYQPDIILMDVAMEVMDGFEALERLKADERTAGIPVALMSAACVRRADAKRGLEAGAALYLKKPLDVLGLAKTLENCIKKKPGTDPGP